MKRVKLNPMVRERDNHQCHFCKRNVHEVCNEVGGGNTLHHIIPKRFSGEDEPENLITICCYCHQKLEIIISKMLKGVVTMKCEEEFIHISKQGLYRCLVFIALLISSIFSIIYFVLMWKYLNINSLFQDILIYEGINQLMIFPLIIISEILLFLLVNSIFCLVKKKWYISNCLIAGLSED